MLLLKKRIFLQLFCLFNLDRNTAVKGLTSEGFFLD